LCNLLGGEIERGELPRDWALIGGLVRDVSFENARRYFGLELPPDESRNQSPHPG
jgi:glucuronate isomerase